MKMDEDIFRKAGIQEIRAEKNMEALLSAIGNSKKSDNRTFFRRFVPVFALFAFFAVGITAGVYFAVDMNNTPEITNSLGGVWCTFDDRPEGGSSVVWPPASTAGVNNFVKSSPGYGDKGYAVRITGTVGGGKGADYIGVLTFLSPKSSCPECTGVDISGYKGIRFKIKGEIEDGNFSFILPYESSDSNREKNTCISLTDYADYEADITGKITDKWKTVSLKFRKDLKRPDNTRDEGAFGIEQVLSDARVIKWQYTGGTGAPVDIWIDELEFF